MPSMQELRQARGWSQQQLADRAGVTQASVSRWEQERRAPTALQLRKLARAFGVSSDDITLPGDEAPR